MFDCCDKCRNRKYDYNTEKASGMIGWTEWIRKKVTYEGKDGKPMKAIKNVREQFSEDAKDFIKRYERDLAAFKKHIFNLKSQFRNFRLCLEHIQPNECVIVADFSENYNCKYHEEIQSHHFASRNQISLHTVVVYTYNAQSSQGYKANSFCTISASNIHQPAAIWCHLDPVLNWIRTEFPSVDTVHFHSDGPSTQYRQKQNFYLMCTKLFDYGFDAMTWSFFESGHGKGPADGVGGYLKRKADQIVANGEDIPNAQQFYEKMHNISKIRLFLIDEKAIKEFHESLPINIPRLVGTLKVHQIFSKSYGTMKFRNLSCFCEKGMSGKRGFCMCMAPKDYDVKIACGIVTNNKPVQSVVDVPEAPLETGGSLVAQSFVDVIDVELPLETPGYSDDEDEPLATLKLAKELQDVTNKRRKRIYKEVYGDSTDDEEPCSS